MILTVGCAFWSVNCESLETFIISGRSPERRKCHIMNGNLILHAFSQLELYHYKIKLTPIRATG